MNSTRSNEKQIGNVSVKEYLMDTINERDRKYEQRFTALDKSVTDTNDSIKEALAAALSSTRDALEKATMNTQAALNTANENIRAALAALDKRFEAVNEFRTQISDSQLLFARKDEVGAALAAMDRAVVKAEAATDKRFEAVNEFRLQLADQQNTFSRKDAVDYQIKGISDRLDTIQDNQRILSESLRTTASRGVGFNTAWVIFLGAVSFASTAIAVGLAFIK